MAAARETFQGAIQGIQRELAKAGPDPLVQAELHGLLGVAYALLGEAAPAIAEGEKAIAHEIHLRRFIRRPASRGDYGADLRRVRRRGSRRSNSQAIAADTLSAPNHYGEPAS